MTRLLLFGGGLFLLFSFGAYKILRKGERMELILFTILMFFTIYTTIAGLNNWPIVSLIQPMEIIFGPFGNWLEHMLHQMKT